MYSASESDLVFLFITIHPNEGRAKRARLSQSKMQTFVARSGLVRFQGGSESSDSLQFVRQNFSELIASFKTDTEV